jgi:hypothetical protein
MYVEQDPTTIAAAPQDAQEVLVERTKPLGNIPDQTKGVCDEFNDLMAQPPA